MKIASAISIDAYRKAI